MAQILQFPKTWAATQNLVAIKHLGRKVNFDELCRIHESDPELAAKLKKEVCEIMAEAEIL